MTTLLFVILTHKNRYDLIMQMVMVSKMERKIG